MARTRPRALVRRPDALDPRAASRGQALVLVALGMALLLGMASIAIDIGRLWTQQRFMQNAADAAALVLSGVVERHAVLSMDAQNRHPNRAVGG